jgi:hypothetical protein
VNGVGGPPDRLCISRWALGAAALALALVGCVVAPQHTRTAPPVMATTPPPADEPHLAELVAFKAVLTGREATPPADSPARGELVAVLNRNTGLFRWKLTYSGLSGPVSARGAHFHGPAASGEEAPSILPAGGQKIVSPYEGRAYLLSAQIDALLAGRWYINLRTARFPDGELRGQLVMQR